jgi:hypothetical protein
MVMIRIVNLQLTIQQRCSVKARKSVVRRDSIEGPFRNTKITIPVDVESGPDSGANMEIRRLVVDALRRYTTKGDMLFYVTAEFERTERTGELSRYFKTIIPRSEIPIPLRRV